MSVVGTCNILCSKKCVNSLILEPHIGDIISTITHKKFEVNIIKNTEVT